MQNTKKILSISNIKKYFPVAKTSLFQKEQPYVRAIENISLDIYEGETLGVVGESGCGKSTLGRTLLQLYPQTAGNTMYYGATLDEITPKYVADTLRHVNKYRRNLSKIREKISELDEKIKAVGEEKADYYLLQSRYLAQCEEQTCFHSIVKILGGFYFRDDDGKGRELLQKVFNENVRRNRLNEKRQNIKNSYEYFLQQNTDIAQRKLHRLKRKLDVLDTKISALDKSTAAYQSKLEDLRTHYGKDADFAKYESMRDTGIDLARLRYTEMRLLRKDLQIIFQDPYSSLNPRMTIGQIIEEGLVTHKFYKHGSPKLREFIVETMKKCGLQEYMLHRYPHQFSGGQRQRVAIARALAVGPKFVVCDECVSALDVSIQSQIINLLQELKEKENLTYMFISHDLSVVRYISDRICVMYLGNVVELGDAKTVFEDPRHPYTVALLSSIPTTDQDSQEKERILLEGNIPSPIKPPLGCKFHTRCYMACDKCKRVPPELCEVEPGHYTACHFPQQKLDQNKNYLFELPENTSKSTRLTRREPSL